MKKNLFLLLFTLAIVGFTACSDDDDNVGTKKVTINFESSKIGLAEETSTSGNVNLNIDGQLHSDLVVQVKLIAPDSLIYGKDFTTTPAAEDNVLKLTIPAGKTNTFFAINSIGKKQLSIADSISLKIVNTNMPDSVKISKNDESSFFFGKVESMGTIMTLQGNENGVVHANSVYVDFSTNTQTVVNRKSWNLGFYNGDKFRVLLNPSDATTAVATTKNNINDVTSADANNVYNIGGNARYIKLPFSIIDGVNGDLTTTVFKEVSKNPAENLVYFVAPEASKISSKNWYKVKVDLTANGKKYKVQYGKADDKEIKTIEIAKNSAYNLSFLSFDKNETVSVEPKAKKWSIMYGSYPADRGDGGVYFFEDYILINNLAGVQAAQIETKAVTFANFKKENIASAKFSNDKNVIGANWRNVFAGIYTDRFYIIKDVNGNYYKLRFLRMGIGNDGGVRGLPVIEYALVK